MPLVRGVEVPVSVQLDNRRRVPIRIHEFLKSQKGSIPSFCEPDGQAGQVPACGHRQAILQRQSSSNLAIRTHVHVGRLCEDRNKSNILITCERRMGAYLFGISITCNHQ